MARPQQISERPLLTQVEINAASYSGSKEHKVVKWWGGLPGVRMGKDGVAKRRKKQLTSICHLVTGEDRAKATSWVREALSKKQYEYCDGDQVYPKHIWYMNENGQRWFGFCINGILGEYKGWPLEEVDV